MNLHRHAARVLVASLPGYDAERRAELTETIEALGGERGTARWRELGSVARLGVQLRSRDDTGAAASASWLQGFHRGAILLIAASAVDAVAMAGTGALVALGAMALVLATWATARRNRWAALALVAAAALLVTVGMAPLPPGAPFLTRLGIAAAALAIGEAPLREHGRLCPGRWMALVATASAVVVVQPGLSTFVVDVVLTAVVPVVWLLVSPADPRLAVGAATAFLWRFVAVDVPRLGTALAAVPTGETVDTLVVRWLVMGTGAAAALWFARSAIRRSTSI